jgi:uncharacterized protein
LNGTSLLLSPAELELLALACEGHSRGDLHHDVTIATCWDADRLDLGRVGIRPQPSRLCTVAAKDGALIERAYTRSRRL